MAEKVKKKLPKRTLNTHKKETRHRSWLRCQDRKRMRQQENEAQHKANLERLAKGELTPWQVAKEKARQRREKQP